MSSKDNHSKTKRIYIKSSREWVDVSEEVYRDYMRHCDATRKRMQYHRRCSCPKKQFWLCDADCLTCEFRRAGDTLSLDHDLAGDTGGLTMLDAITDPAPLIEDTIADYEELSELLHRLAEVMPEAIKVGLLREQGLSESAIAAELGIPRTTLRSRLSKAREQLKPEFPHIL